MGLCSSAADVRECYLLHVGGVPKVCGLPKGRNLRLPIRRECSGVSQRMLAHKTLFRYHLVLYVTRATLPIT